MATYKTVNPLNGIDAAYIAGLIDGEGTITLARIRFEGAVLQIKPVLSEA